MKEQGITEAVVASTGNVAIAYSAYAARAGIKLWAFMPSLVPSDKIREVALYGTEVIKVTGTYDQTKETAARFAEHKGIHEDEHLRGVPQLDRLIVFGVESELLAQRVSDVRSPSLSSRLRFDSCLAKEACQEPVGI